MRSFSVKFKYFVRARPGLIAAFVAFSVVSAFAEGFGVSLLAPLLESTAAQSQDAFGSVPFVGRIAALFAAFHDDRTRIIGIACTMAVIFLLRGLTQFAANALSVSTPLTLLEHLGRAAYDGIVNATLRFVDGRERGELVALVASYPVRAAQVMTDFCNVLSNGLVFIVYLLLMLFISWKLTLGAAVFLVFASASLRGMFDTVLRRAGHQLSEAQADVQSLIQETLNGLKLIRLSVGERLMSERFGEALRRMVAAQRRSAVLAEVPNPFLTTSASLFICLALVAGALLLSGNSGPWVGKLLLFLFLLFRMLLPIVQLNGARTRIVGNVDAISRLNTFGNEAAHHRDPEGGTLFPAFERSLVLENVSFRYGDNLRPAISHLDLTVRRGEFVAIVGPSGAGKTTIVGLIARLFDPTDGRILVDGNDLRTLDVKDWRRRIGIVSQDIFIFNDTVTSNICFPRASAPEDRLHDAVALASADTFVEELPEGFDTRLGDRGTRLSGGQQQRIAIARAVVAKPDVLILDEATSHLDSLTETAIQRAIDTLSHQATLIVIAHRLSTVRKADRIIVLQQGRIVEQGSHAELSKAQGQYWHLLSHQLLGLVE